MPTSTPANKSSGVEYSAAINGNFFQKNVADPNATYTCSQIEGFVGTGTATWSCGNATLDRNEWGFGISTQDSVHVVAPNVAGGGGHQPAAAVWARPYGLDDVGLLIKNGTPQPVDTNWPGDPTGSRCRSLLVWSKDGKHSFMIIIGYKGTDFGVTWAGTVDFLTNTFAKVIAKNGIAIGDAVMLDGGSSSQIGYRRVKYGTGDPPFQWDREDHNPPVFTAPYKVPTFVHTYAHIP